MREGEDVTEEELEVFKDVARKGAQEAVRVELGDFKVEKQKHYDDHKFLTELREWVDSIQSTFWKTIAKAVATGIVLLLILGFAKWGGLNLSK